MTQLHKPGEYATIKVEVPATHPPSVPDPDPNAGRELPPITTEQE